MLATTNTLEFTRRFAGYPVPSWSPAIKQPLSIDDAADAILLMTESHRNIGKEYTLWGPRAYTFRRLVELFAFASFTEARIQPMPRALFYAYGRMSVSPWQSPFPLDFIKQLGENDFEAGCTTKPPTGAPGMSSLGFLKLQTVEELLPEVTRGYRQTEYYGEQVTFPDEMLADSILLPPQDAAVSVR